VEYSSFANQNSAAEQPRFHGDSESFRKNDQTDSPKM